MQNNENNTTKLAEKSLSRITKIITEMENVCASNGATTDGFSSSLLMRKYGALPVNKED